MRIVIKTRLRLVGSLTISLLTVLAIFYAAPSAWAGQLQSRSLNLASVKAGDITRHTVDFNFPGIANVGSIVFEYCANSPLEAILCLSPAGLDASSATLSAQSGETGFSILSQSANSITIHRTSAATGLGANSYEFSGVKNPSNVGSFYLRIHTYPSIDGTGPENDFGATVGVITQGVTIT